MLAHCLVLTKVAQKKNFYQSWRAGKPSFLRTQPPPEQQPFSAVQKSYCFKDEFLEILRCSLPPPSQVYINQVCKDVLSGPLDSAVQLAGLRLLTNMTVTNDHQHMLTDYVTDLFHVLLTGDGSTKVRMKQL